MQSLIETFCKDRCIGPVGTAGPAGFAGAPGAIGNQGTIILGAAGATGIDGPAGETGPGIIGAIGETGPEGETGPLGGTGNPGSSFSSFCLIQPGLELDQVGPSQLPETPFVSWCVHDDQCFKIWGCVELDGGIAAVSGLTGFPVNRVDLSADELGWPGQNQDLIHECSNGIWTACIKTGATGLSGQGDAFSGKIEFRYCPITRQMSMLFRNCANPPASLPPSASLSLFSFIGCGQLSPTGTQPLTNLIDFESVGIAGFIPPDSTNAVGPDHVVIMVNTQIAIHDKRTGTNLAQQNLNNAGGFFGSVGATSTVFDPWIVYDFHVGRFVGIAIEVVAQSFMYFCVSTTSRPTNLTTDWYKFRLNRTDINGNFPDYPKLGYDDKAYYITGNNFPGVSLFALEKAPLLVGGAPNILFDTLTSNAFFSAHPMMVYDCPSKAMYFAEADDNGSVFNFIRIWAITDILGTPVLTRTSVTVNVYTAPIDVTQPNGAFVGLDTIGVRTMSGVVRNNRLWTAHAVQDTAVTPPPNATQSLVRWYEFDVSTWPGGAAPTVLQQNSIDPAVVGCGGGPPTAVDGSTDSIWMPHINVDVCGNMALGVSIAGPDRFGAMAYTGRLATDPINTVRPLTIARDGEANYQLTDSFGRNRWGDYSGLALDPNGRTFWAYNEYAATGNIWRTYVAAFQMASSHSTFRTIPLHTELRLGLELDHSEPLPVSQDQSNNQSKNKADDNRELEENEMLTREGEDNRRCLGEPYHII